MWKSEKTSFFINKNVPSFDWLSAIVSLDVHYFTSSVAALMSLTTCPLVCMNCQLIYFPKGWIPFLFPHPANSFGTLHSKPRHHLQTVLLSPKHPLPCRTFQNLTVLSHVLLPVLLPVPALQSKFPSFPSSLPSLWVPLSCCSLNSPGSCRFLRRMSIPHIMLYSL